MDFLELAQKRYSVRKYSDKPIPNEVLTKILEAGRIAPTAKNNQPQRIYVLKSDEALAKIRENTTSAFDAPVVLMICCDTFECWSHPETNEKSAEMDASIVCTHLMMQATDLGLGSCWVLRFDKALAKKQFDLPENIEPYCLLPIGYPADDAKPSFRHEDKKPLEDTTIVL